MPAADFLERGRTGLKRFGGYIQEEFLRDLRGRQGIKVYREMRDNSAVVGAIAFAIEQLIRQVSWVVEPDSEQTVDVEAAEYLDSCRQDMSSTWEDTLAEILEHLWFGWSWHELVYKRRDGANRDPSKNSRFTDGRIGWRKIPIRGQDSLLTWDFDDEG